MKNLLPRALVVVRTSKRKISRHCLVDYVKTLHQKACGTCSTIIFLHSTNQNIDLWRCRCRRHLLNPSCPCDWFKWSQGPNLGLRHHKTTLRDTALGSSIFEKVLRFCIMHVRIPHLRPASITDYTIS